MSLFYMTVKTIKKSTQSAVASASYRSGQDLYSDRDQEMKSYKEREVQPDSFILAPSHAPEWATDRERLWNEVELVENRWNSRLAREVLVALPIELSNDTQKQLLTEFVQENFVDDGMVADVSIHRDREQNPHAHIMLTVRPFNEDGTWGNKKKREYVLDENGEQVLNAKGEKKFKTIQLTDWDKEESLLKWRKNFAEKINEYYIEHGINESVSHLSYEEQGLDKIPKLRLTREEYAIEKKAKEQAEIDGTEYVPTTHYAKHNQEIEEDLKLLSELEKEIEEVQSQIDKLDTKDQAAYEETIHDLNAIRKGIKLSNKDWESLKLVAKRVGGFVDYNSAQSNVVKLDNWKKKLDSQFNMLKAEMKVLETVKNIYKEEPKKVLLYGFIPNKFEQQYKEQSNDFNKRMEQFNKTKESFDNIYNQSTRVFDIQKEFVKEEFNFLYKQYNGVLEQNDKAFDLQNKYVKDFKVNGNLANQIDEIDNNIHRYKSDYIKLESLVKDWDENNNSLVILQRVNSKLRKEFNAVYKEYDSNKLYAATIKIAENKEQIKTKEDTKQRLQNEILKELITRYPNVSETIIQSIPVREQRDLLELHLNDQQSGSLSKDLTTLKEIREQLNRENNKDPNEHSNENDSSGSNVAAGLLDGIIQAARQNEKQDDDLERQRKKKHKPRMINHELEKD